MKVTSNYCLDILKIVFKLTYIFILIFFQINLAQDEQINVFAVIDTSSIKIGEQFNYTIQAESENINGINFPKKFDFSPFEIAKEFSLDTTFFKGKKILSKKFNLTKFDEGSFVILPQKILFNNKEYYTQPFPIDVVTIKVDTVSKKFFDIRPIATATETKIPIKKYIFSLLILVLGIIIIYMIYKKFKNHVIDKNIFKTPYENAIIQLDHLENQNINLNKDPKFYYSRLTEIAKDYLENDINISALESTTTQLIEKINLFNNSKKINITNETLDGFKKILNNADLVKFAKHIPKKEILLADNRDLKLFIVNTKKSIPNNIQQENEQKKIMELRFNRIVKKRKVKYVFASLSVLFMTITSFIILLFGIPKFDTIFTLNNNKKLLKKDWITSVYTPLNLSMESPDVLLRLQDSVKNKLRFTSSNKNFEINLTTNLSNQNADIISDLLNDFKKREFQNIITKTDEFETIDGDKGIKIFGSFDDKKSESKKNYIAILFLNDKYSVQLEIIYLRNEKNLEDAADKIIRSLKFIKS